MYLTLLKRPEGHSKIKHLSALDWREKIRMNFASITERGIVTIETLVNLLYRKHFIDPSEVQRVLQCEKTCDKTRTLLLTLLRKNSHLWTQEFMQALKVNPETVRLHNLIANTDTMLGSLDHLELWDLCQQAENRNEKGI